MNVFDERNPWFTDSSISDMNLGSLFDPWGDHLLGATHAQVAEILDVPRAFICPGGTTVANKLALYTLIGPGDVVLVERDCHVSILQTITEIGAIPIWFTPPFDSELGVNLATPPQRLAAVLEHHPQAKAVVLTSPKYFGIGEDLRACVALCQEHELPLLVDEAHGAFLRFYPPANDTPTSAIAAGASLITQSIHKSTEALSQGSVLLFNDERLCSRFLHVLNGTPAVSTSFNYGIIASVEEALVNLAGHGDERLFAAHQLATRLRAGLGGIKGLSSWGTAQAGREGFRALDPLRVTVDVSGLGLSGIDVETRLQECQPPIIAELGDLRNVLFLVTYGNTHQDIDTLVAHLARLASRVSERSATSPQVAIPQSLPEAVLTPRQAFWAVADGARNGAVRRVPVEQAIGQVSGETIAVYPPGNALLVQGETVTREALDYLRKMAELGATLKGATDPRLKTDHEFTSIQVISSSAVERLSTHAAF